MTAPLQDTVAPEDAENPSVDALATCILPRDNIVDALPFDALFDPRRPVEIDLGSGKGRFLLARATAHPDVQFLGIDRMLPRIRKLDRKILRAGLTNVRLLRLEAAYTLRFLLPPHRIQRFYIFFPDPWPKRRHHKRRLFAGDFRDVLWSRLVPGGEVQVATDHLDYGAEIRSCLREDPRFEEIAAMERSEAEQTDFELIFRGQGLPIGTCAFRSRAAAPVER